jgi:DNA repair protein RadA/Sms
MLAEQGKKVAYISGEESIVQISFNSKRLNLSNVMVSNLKDVDDICSKIEANGFHFVVIDSFPTITVKKTMSSKKKEEYIVQKLCSTAKKCNIVIGIIQHVTKSGVYKGSSLLPHSVDLTIKMQKNEEDVEELTKRDFIVTKNRFGSTSFISLNLKDKGFVFETSKKVKPLEGVRKITLDDAVKTFGSYYQANKQLIALGFIKKQRGVYTRV